MDKLSRLTTFLSTLLSAILITAIVFFLFMIDDIKVSSNYYYVSLSTLFFIFFTVTFTIRLIIYNDIAKRYKSKKWSINTIIIGNGVNAKRIADVLTESSEKNSLIGFVTVDNSASSIPKDAIIGSFNQMDSIIEKNNIEEAIIALDNPDELKLFSYINTLYKYNIEIRFTPRLYEILTGSARIGRAGIQPLVSLTDIHMPNWQIAMKRIFDIALSSVMLILLLPVFLYFAIVIKIDSRGPVYYRQERVGRYGKPFNILKFRTMHINAENGVPKLSSADDERVTAIGRTLRKYRIDELPQFWNILKGDMSIVGPRPERKYYINQIIEQAPYYCLLYKIRPGLTSWGPIKIGYSDTIEKMVERLNYDIIYMEDMTLLNDLRILILTLEILFKGKGV